MITRELLFVRNADVEIDSVQPFQTACPMVGLLSNDFPFKVTFFYTGVEDVDCRITVYGDEFTYDVYGLSHCTGKDSPDRLVGRRIAFEKAVAQLVNREDRDRVWATFFKNCKQPEIRKYKASGFNYTQFMRRWTNAYKGGNNVNKTAIEGQTEGATQ